MNCPNCGSGDYDSIIGTSDPTQQLYGCRECGTRWYHNGLVSHVPTRSRPAEVLELPDAEGWWWYWSESLCEWRCGYGQEKLWIVGFGGTVSAADYKRYVRAVPPIDPPAKPEPDPDAERLKRDIIRLRERLAIATEACSKGKELCEWLDAMGTIENVETFTELFTDALDQMKGGE